MERRRGTIREASIIRVAEVVEGRPDGISGATEAATHAREHVGRDVPAPDSTPGAVIFPVAVRRPSFGFALVPTLQPSGGVRSWLRCGQRGVRGSALSALGITTGGVVVGRPVCHRRRWPTPQA